MTVSSAAAEAESSTTALVSTITEPVTKHSRAVYDIVVGGVHRYIEGWEDLIAEADAAVHPHDASITLDSVLAGLADARVASDIPGRLRLRPKGLKGNNELTGQVARALGSLRGIDQVEVSSRTGSVLIHYDKSEWTSGGALREHLSGLGNT